MAAPARIDLAEIRRTHETLLATDDPEFAYSRARAWQVLALVEAVEAAQEQMRVMAPSPRGRFPHQDRLRAALASFGEPAA